MLDLAPKTSDLDAIEVASRDEITALQLERLGKTLRHAYAKVPHYRNAFDDKGVHPDDLKSLSDLSARQGTIRGFRAVAASIIHFRCGSKAEVQRGLRNVRSWG